MGFLLLSGGKPVENSFNCGKKPFLNIFKRFISCELMLVFIVILASRLTQTPEKCKWGWYELSEITDNSWHKLRVNL